MIDLLFAKFHAASVSMGADGGLLLSGTRERVLVWGIVFCLLAAAALSFWLMNIRRRTALVVLLFSLLIPALVMPAVRKEHIHVLPDRITVNTGGWLETSGTIISLENLRQIREQQIQFGVPGYIVEPNAIWHLEYRDGSKRLLILNDFFTAHRMAVGQYLRDRGHIVR